MAFVDTKQWVPHGGVPPDAFLDELVDWGTGAPDDIFFPNANRDVYSSVAKTLGPWEGPEHRRAVMLEVMRVLAGFESSWHWNEGRDTSNPKSYKPETTEAGAFQVSSNSMGWGPELRNLVRLKAGGDDPATFQRAMKQNHELAMEYIARLLRRTVAANGPVLRHEIDRYLHKASVKEFQALMFPTPGSKREVDDNCTPQLRGRL